MLSPQSGNGAPSSSTHQPLGNWSILAESAGWAKMGESAAMDLPVRTAGASISLTAGEPFKMADITTGRR